MTALLRHTHHSSDLRYARSIILRVCKIAGHLTCIDDLRHEATDAGLIAAVDDHNTPVIFDWLVGVLSFQGISDVVAGGFIARHGNVTWSQIEGALNCYPNCTKLKGYWTFTRCGYTKDVQSCNNADQFRSCPLPRHNLRNGRLNQTAYSLFLFIRDIADGDVVGWIDQQIAPHISKNNLAGARDSLMEPLRHIYGVSDKVVTMALATLLMGAGANRPGWFDIGAGCIVVDTLVHNFLVRTGILMRLGGQHPYGPGCYRPGGCAHIVSIIANRIDGRQFNVSFPKTFPRFIQNSIWRYCSQAGVDVCNGNQIDDRSRCSNMWCRLYTQCDRLSLRENSKGN